MLSLRDKIILFLDLLYDEGIFSPRCLVFSAFNSSDRTSVDKRLRQMAHSGQLEVKGGGLGRTISLSPSLRNLLEKEDFDLVKIRSCQTKWDGLWRLVVFDISEENRKLRDLLRRKLRSLGFAMFQKSVWVTPLDVTEQVTRFLKKAGIKGPVEVLEAKRIFTENEKDWVGRYWDLEKVNGQYRRLLKQKETTFDDYLEVKVNDPSLPKELLPSPWFESELIEVLRRRARSLT